MGCCGSREKFDDFVRIEQRWDYINLDEFRTKSCWTPFAYIWLWLMLIVSVSVYAVDTFTAVNLVAFDNWAGQIKPVIPFPIARWIFSGCIIASFILLFYRWWRAVKVMKQGGVAKSYLDPLAVRIQSIRMGSRGRGYKRFLVFAELTKSRKGADYVALFSYFSFEAWLRIVFAEGPRQAVNAMTLFNFMQLKLIPSGNHNVSDGRSSFVQFWFNMGVVIEQDKLQAAILLGMLWTLFIWLLAAISLAVSVVLYLIYLWHHIPKSDGSLGKYCRNKINRRMERIVQRKVEKGLRKENEIRSKQEAIAARDGLTLKSQPTLPDFGTDDHGHPGLSRQGTMTTLPEYASRPGSSRAREDEVPPMPNHFNDPYRPMPERHGTQRSDHSWNSYESDAPLIKSAGGMGMDTPMSAMSAPWPSRGAPQRSQTGFSQHSDRTTTPAPRPPTAQSGPSYQMDILPRPGTAQHGAPYPEEPIFQSEPPSVRGRTPAPGNADPIGGPSSFTTPYPQDQGIAELPADSDPPNRFNHPIPPARSYTSTGLPPRSFTPSAQPPRSFTPAGPPPRAFTPGAPLPGPAASVGPLSRSFTPGPPPPTTFTPNRYPPQSFDRQPSPPRSYTPAEPPPSRSFTPYGPPPARSFTPYDQSTLLRIDTNMPSNSFQMPLDPRSATPTASRHYNNSPGPGQFQQYPPHQNYNYNRPQGPGQRNNSLGRDSGVDDILSHY